MTDAFIFFTRAPDAAPRILKKFIEATENSKTDFRFHLCSYDDASPGEHKTIEVLGRRVDYWTYGRSDAFSMGFKNKVPNEDWVLIPGHCDVPILNFFRDNPDYDRYWLAEDDVDYSGQLSDLLDELSDFNEDLVCTHLHTGWEGWTYNKTLMCGDRPQLKPEETLLCFLPLFRISKAGTQAIDNAYSNGWSGHHEQVWPTVVRDAGLSLRDIGGSGEFVPEEYINRYYLGEPVVGNNKVGTFVPTPPRLRVGSRKNTLYHPVKPLGLWWFGKKRRLRSVLSYYKIKFGIS